MSAAALADAAPGRFVLGLGASSPVIVGNWNGIAFDRPYQRTRDVLRFVRAALAGERVDGEFDTFTVKRFKLEQPPAQPPPILLAALRPQMLRAGRAGGRRRDPELAGVRRTSRSAWTAIDNPDAEVVARIFVCPTEDTGYARARGASADLDLPDRARVRRVPRLAGPRRWRCAAMHEAWAAGDRAGAAAAIPRRGASTTWSCTARRSRAASRSGPTSRPGVRTPVLALLPTPEAADAAALLDVVRRLGPAALRCG